MVKMIFAVEDETNIIGLNKRLPWRVKEDLEYFKKTTMGKKLVCGSTTFSTLPKLEGRMVYVATRNPEKFHDIKKPEAFILSLTDWLDMYGDKEDIYIIGGAKIYELCKDRANELLISRIKLKDGSHFTGDTKIFDYTKDFYLAETIDTIDAVNTVPGDYNMKEVTISFEVWKRKVEA